MAIAMIMTGNKTRLKEKVKMKRNNENDRMKMTRCAPEADESDDK